MHNRKNKSTNKHVFKLGLPFTIQVPPDQLLTLRETAKASFGYDLSDMKQAMTVVGLDYSYSKFVRGDNSPKCAKYLGYLDASDLHPNFIPRSFEAFANELLDGKAAKIFGGINLRA